MAARWVGLEGFKRLERLERFRAGKRQTWTPIRSHWCVALGCLLTARVATRSHWCVALGCLLAARVAIRSHWCVARGGCWLQGEVWRVLGLGNGRSYWCGLMAARWVGLEGFKRLERLERLERFRAGKRQTWTPIRSHWCVALGCLLTARVATRSHWCVARGGCWLQEWPQEAIDVWLWGGGWLQEWPQEAIDVWRGVAVGCRMKHAKSTFEGFYRFSGFGGF